MQRAASMAELYPAGRKLCAGRRHRGQRWIHLHYFKLHTRKNQAGAMIWLQFQCLTCSRLDARARHNRKPRPSKKNREEMAKYRARLYQEKKAKLAADPEALAAHLETQRFRATEKRRAQGIPERKFSRKATSRAVQPIDSTLRTTLHPGPLQRFIRVYDGDWVQLARQAGVSARLIDKIMKQPGYRVSLDAADKLLMAMGIHIDLVYDHEE